MGKRKDGFEAKCLRCGKLYFTPVKEFAELALCEDCREELEVADFDEPDEPFGLYELGEPLSDDGDEWLLADWDIEDRKLVRGDCNG